MHVIIIAILKWLLLFCYMSDYPEVTNSDQKNSMNIEISFKILLYE